MNHLHLTTDIAMILGVTGVTTLLFKKLKQPLVLGFILAGKLLSKNFEFVLSVIEIQNVQVWAEIVAIFLLLSSGLELSFKSLDR